MSVKNIIAFMSSLTFLIGCVSNHSIEGQQGPEMEASFYFVEDEDAIPEFQNIEPLFGDRFLCSGQNYLMMMWIDQDNSDLMTIELKFENFDGLPSENAVAQATFRKDLRGRWVPVYIQTIAERIPAIRRNAVDIVTC